MAFNPRTQFESMDVIFITLDTLRYDVAQTAWRNGDTPNLAQHLGADGWECRHTPASFTYAAHHAFFAGFLPTPITPGPHSRLFASRFVGSESTAEHTFIFDQATLPEALSAIGFHTICIGGTGFFNPENSLGRVLPGLFDESHWSSKTSVTNRESESNQIGLAIQRMRILPQQNVFTFINISAIHQPNWFYQQSSDQPEGRDTIESHAAALSAVDTALSKLFSFCMKKERPSFFIICSDHGTAYGENGYTGHRVAHEVIWNVPYTQFVIGNGASQ